MKKLLKLAIAACLTVASLSASATVVWTDWTSITSSTAQGNLNGVGVTVSGLFNGVSQVACGINYWTEPDASDPAFTGGDLSVAPTNCEQVGMNTATSVNVVFESEISKLYMALLSVGQPRVPVTYSFDTSVSIDSEGRGYWGNDVTVYSSGSTSTLTMREFHGVLEFDNPITSMTFSTLQNENWHAFTFGTVTSVNAPSLMGFLTLVLVPLLLTRNRKIKV